MNRYRRTERGGGLFSAIEHEQAVAARTVGILKLRDVIPWESFRPLLDDLTGYATRDWKKGGKPPFDPVLMLQRFHGLSDDATEQQIFDRTSFKAFLGLRIGDDIPDAKTLWDFKQRIEADGREGGRKLFEAFGLILEGKGIIAREGSIFDASFTEDPRQLNERDQNQRIKRGERPEEFDTNPAVGRQKDSEARWTKKNNESHHGWKNHVKADLKTKLILKATTTPASVHDSQVFEELLDDEDQAGEKGSPGKGEKGAGVSYCGIPVIQTLASMISCGSLSSFRVSDKTFSSDLNSRMPFCEAGRWMPHFALRLERFALGNCPPSIK